MDSGGGTEYRLVTSAVFDRETKAEYHLQVTCHDSAADGTVLTSTETLTVDVADVNDNDPVFTQTVYRAELIENNYVGAVVFKVGAGREQMKFLCGTATTGCVMHCILIILFFVCPTVHYYGLASNSIRKNRNIVSW